MSGIELLAAGAAAASIATAGVSAMGAIQSGKAQQQASLLNADLSRQQATQEMQAGAIASGQVYDERRRDLARSRAAAAASGVDATTGSPLDVLTDLAGKAKLEEDTTFWNGFMRARAAGSQASVDEFRGTTAVSASKGQAFGTLLGAGSSAIGTYRSVKAAF